MVGWRVLVSSGFLGGAGGAERALQSITRALSEAGADVDVVVRTRLGGAWATLPPGVGLATAEDWRWWGAGHRSGPKGLVLQTLLNPLRRLVNGRYDAQLQFLAGATIAGAAHVGPRFLIPSGNVIDRATAQRFDAIAMQAPDNDRLVPNGVPAVLLPPPVFDLSADSEPPHVDLPRRFLLTVFNPYDPIKGMAELERAAAEAPLPIVWCHSEATVRFEIPPALARHPKIVHVLDATPSQLRYLYERCSGYASFSLTEGFGWSAADALRYSPAVITRSIGVFSNKAAVQPGVTLIGDDGAVDWENALSAGCEPRDRDLSVIDGTHFPETFRAAVTEFDG